MVVRLPPKARTLILVAGRALGQLMCSNKPRQSLALENYAPTVLQVDEAVWQEHKALVLGLAAVTEVGRETQSSRMGECHGGRWFYVGKAPAWLQYRRGYEGNPDYALIRASIDAANENDDDMDEGNEFKSEAGSAAAASAGPPPRHDKRGAVVFFTPALEEWKEMMATAKMPGYSKQRRIEKCGKEEQLDCHGGRWLCVVQIPLEISNC